MKNKQIKKILTVAVSMMTALAACGDNAVEAGSNNVKAETTANNTDMAEAGPGSEEAVTLEESKPAIEADSETTESETAEEADADPAQGPETPSDTPTTSPKPSAEPKESAKPAESNAGTNSTANNNTTAQNTQASPKPAASAQPSAIPSAPVTTPQATPKATPAHTHSWNAHYITVIDMPAWSEDQYVSMPKYETRIIMNGYPYLDVTDWSYDQRVQWDYDHGIGRVDENGNFIAGQNTSCFNVHSESVQVGEELIWVGTIEHPAVTHQEIDYYTCSCGETKK